ncbi:MAG: SIMPL domain-containing protein [Ardenticatenaceae bacterium]
MSRQSLLLTAIVAALTILAIATFSGRLALAQGENNTPEPFQRTVSVSGSGEISAVPDQATIELGVRTQASTAAEALDENNAKMQALTGTLRQAGIAARDIQTSDFSIWPQYRNPSEGETTISGYEVSNRVAIKVRDLSAFGEILDQAVQAGGNQVNSIQFGFGDPSALLDQAREEAMADAAHKATQLAQLAGMNLGVVVTISESGAVPPPIIMRGAADMEQAAVPIETGESTVSVSIQVTYELTQ